MKFVKTFSGPKNLIDIIGSDPTILIGGLSLAKSASESACIEVEIFLQKMIGGEPASIKGYVPRYSAKTFGNKPVIEIVSKKPFASESALMEATVIFLCAHAQEDFTFYKSPLPAAYFPLVRIFG